MTADLHPILVLVVRIALIGLVMFNMGWTAPGVLAQFRGRLSLLASIKSAIFFLSAGTFAFQMFAVAGRANDTTRLMSSITLLIGAAIVASLFRSFRQLDKIGRLLVNIPAALAIVDLWLVDPVAGEAQATECRRLTAEVIARG